jgi:hypothetical protein
LRHRGSSIEYRCLSRAAGPVRDSPSIGCRFVPALSVRFYPFRVQPQSWQRDQAPQRYSLRERSLLDLKHLDFGQNCRSSALPYGLVPLGSNEGLASALSIAFGWLTVSLVSEAIGRTDGRGRRGAGASPRRAAISRSISSRWALRSIRRARRCSVVSCFMSGPFPLVEAHRRQSSEWLSGVVAHSRILAPRKADDCAFSVAAGCCAQRQSRPGGPHNIPAC